MSWATNGLSAYGTYSKVDDVQQGLTDLKKTYDNPNLTKSQKIAQCTAEATFISARCGELCVKDPISLPFINGVATVSDVGRNIIRGCNESQPPAQIVLKTVTAALSGIGETIINISKITQSVPGTIIGFAFSISGMSLSFYQIYARRSSLTP